jgi:ClpP class serine protease
LAQRIRAASALKPVWAHANDAAYSAAYAIAASASRLTLSQTAGVGSIGVIALHVDQSIRDAREGLAYTAIYAGHHKNDFSPHAPLTPQASSSLQSEVDRLYGIFVDQVASMRAMSAQAVRDTEAGLFFGDAAVEAGLADAVSGLDQVLADFAAALAVKHRLKSPSLSPNPNPGAPAKRGPQARASPLALTAASVISHPHPLQTEQTMTDPENADPQQAPTPQEPLAPSEAPNPQAPNPLTTAEAAKASVSSARGEAQAIAEICLIAGASQRTAEFLASGMTQPQVRRALLEARAEQPEIASRFTAEAGTTLRPQSSPVVAAVKKLMNRE